MQHHAPHPAPPDTEILEAYFTANGDLAATARALNLPLTALVATLRKRHLADEIAAWKDLVTTQHRVAAMTHQAAAASALRKTIDASADPVEIRRAATTLARLATSMLAPACSAKPQSVAPPLAADQPLTTARPAPSFPPITFDDVLAEVDSKRKRQPA